MFKSITGHSREDVDWDVEDNQAGYYTWLKSFDQLAQELVEDGFAAEIEVDGKPMFRSVDGDPALWTQPADPRQV